MGIWYKKVVLVLDIQKQRCPPEKKYTESFVHQKSLIPTFFVVFWLNNNYCEFSTCIQIKIDIKYLKTSFKHVNIDF